MNRPTPSAGGSVPLRGHQSTVSDSPFSTSTRIFTEPAAVRESTAHTVTCVPSSTVRSAGFSPARSVTVERHSALSRFAAPFLNRMSFLDEHDEGASPTLKAVRMYRELRTSGRRTLPSDTPVDFAPKALEPLIRRDGAIDRRCWESALFLKMRDEIRAGNLAIDGAKNFGRIESFFLPERQWQQSSEAFWARTGFPADPDPAPQQLKARLSAAFDRFLEDVPRNRQVSFDDDGWRLKTDRAKQLDPEQSASLIELRRWLDANRRPIRLADLLIEVENDLRFSAHFLHPGEKQADTGEVCALPAAVLAHGCNLGLYTMEKLAPGIPYGKLRHVSDWRLVEENQRAALAGIVQALARAGGKTRKRTLRAMVRATTEYRCTVLVLVGDVAMGEALGDATWERIRRSPARHKHLVIGNHDLTGLGELRAEGFDDVWSMMVSAGAPPLVWTHHPLVDIPAGHVNIHGHAHGAPPGRSAHINVAVEQLDYEPVRLDRLRRLARAP